jgi:hypothetical protein
MSNQSIDTMNNFSYRVATTFTIATLILLLGTISVQAQATVPIGDFLKNETNETKLNISQSGNKTIEGSPYLYDGEWLNAEIIIDQSTTTSETKIMYNLDKNRLEVQYSNSILLVQPNSIIGFATNRDGHRVEFRSGYYSKEKEISKNQLVQVLYKGDIQMIKAFDVSRSESTSPDMDTGNYVTTFIQSEDYYLIDGNGNYKDLKLGRWRFLRMFDGNTKSKIKDYAKEHDLSYRDEYDVAEMIKFYDSL